MTEATNTRRGALEEAAQEAERIGSAWAEDADCPKTSRAVGKRIAETIRSLKGDANTPAGMKAWSGGDTAPADWDGGSVLLRNGYLGEAGHWGRGAPAPLGYEGDNDIVAYTPQAVEPDRLDWLKIARAAGKHGVRYRTNRAFAEFLAEIATPQTSDGSGPGSWVPAEQLAQANERIAELEGALRSIDNAYDNCDISHDDFRVAAKLITDAALRQKGGE